MWPWAPPALRTLVPSHVRWGWQKNQPPRVSDDQMRWDNPSAGSEHAGAQWSPAPYLLAAAAVVTPFHITENLNQPFLPLLCKVTVLSLFSCGLVDRGVFSGYFAVSLSRFPCPASHFLPSQLVLWEISSGDVLPGVSRLSPVSLATYQLILLFLHLIHY